MLLSLEYIGQYLCGSYSKVRNHVRTHATEHPIWNTLMKYLNFMILFKRYEILFSVEQKMGEFIKGKIKGCLHELDKEVNGKIKTRQEEKIFLRNVFLLQDNQYHCFMFSLLNQNQKTRKQMKIMMLSQTVREVSCIFVSCELVLRRIR